MRRLDKQLGWLEFKGLPMSSLGNLPILGRGKKKDGDLMKTMMPGSEAGLRQPFCSICFTQGSSSACRGWCWLLQELGSAQLWGNLAAMLGSGSLAAGAGSASGAGAVAAPQWPI